MGNTQITAEPGIPQIIITREFDAPRDLVFRAHTDPELLAQWLGPRELTMTVDEYDVRDGGKWRYVKQRSGVILMFGGYGDLVPASDQARAITASAINITCGSVAE